MSYEHRHQPISATSQPICTAIIEQQHRSMEDKLVELRAKMQHRRRSRVQESLINNTTVVNSEEDPLFNWKKTIDCAICMSLYEVNEIVVRSDQCQHIFHRDCMVSWLMKDKKASCPCCRQRFT